jgi:hypothetical protein
MDMIKMNGNSKVNEEDKGQGIQQQDILNECRFTRRLLRN